MQRADPPDRELLALGDLGRPLERRARGSEIADALPAADDLERLERDFCGPAFKPSRLGAGERAPRERSASVQVASVDCAARRHGVGPA